MEEIRKKRDKFLVYFILQALTQRC